MTGKVIKDRIEFKGDSECDGWFHEFMGQAAEIQGHYKEVGKELTDSEARELTWLLRIKNLETDYTLLKSLIYAKLEGLE